MWFLWVLKLHVTEIGTGKFLDKITQNTKCLIFYADNEEITKLAEILPSPDDCDEFYFMEME